MKTALGLLAFLLLVLSPWAIPTAYVTYAGSVVQGEIIGKTEAFALTGNENWRHVLDVTYRFKPSDSRVPETATHSVDLALFDRLRVGDRVKIRYSPWSPLRSLRGVGSVLADSSALSRLPIDGAFPREAFDMALVCLAGVLAFIAYRRKTAFWCLAAALAGGVVCTGVLPSGFIALPVLLGIWWNRPGKGYGWVLLAAMLLSALIMYWRIPQPFSAPTGASHDATAVVRQMETVDQIWHIEDEGAQDIRRAFQMVDLEFTPVGAAEPVHVLDRVDEDSIRGLRVGATVPVTYSVSNPRIARISGGSRTYPEDALIYLLEVTYGGAAVVVFVVWPILLLLDKAWAWIRGLHSSIPVDRIAANLSRFPAGDPRRKALEKVLEKLPEIDRLGKQEQGRRGPRGAIELDRRQQR